MLELLPGWHVLPPPPGLTSATTLGGGLAGAPGTALGLFPHLREGCACPGDSRSLGFGEREITVGNLSKPRGASEEKDGCFPCAALSGIFCSAHIPSGPRNEATLLPPAPWSSVPRRGTTQTWGVGSPHCVLGLRRACADVAVWPRLSWAGGHVMDGKPRHGDALSRFPVTAARQASPAFGGETESGPCARSVGKRPGLSGLTRCQMQHRG